jgi:SAM-dependent methyltransferase
MNHADHVSLLQPAQLPLGGAWADFGAGSGAFTLALRELVGADAAIYALDKDAAALRELERKFSARFGSTANLQLVPGDFTRPLQLPALDGAIMPNSLHYFPDEVPASSSRLTKLDVLKHVRSYLKPGGMLLLVEYNVDAGNMWVPHPLSFDTWRELAPRAGFTTPRLLATHPSNFLRQFYSAVCAREPLL